MSERWTDKASDWLFQQIKDGDDDLLMGGVVAVATYLIDSRFFPDGMASQTAAALYGTLGFLLLR